MPTGVYVRTEEHCRRVSEGMRSSAVKIGRKKGNIPWNKGKKIGYCPGHAFKKGNIPWNKGKNLIPVWNKGLKGVQVSPMKGKKHSEESKQKMRNSRDGWIPWNKGNGIYKRDKDGKRLTRIKLAGKLTRKMIQLVYEDNIKKHGTLTCYLCELQIMFGEDSLEHKIPISRGGKNVYENLDIAHRRCNSRKGNKTIEEYKATLLA